MDPRNTKSYRLGVIGFITTCNFINALDRASLSVAVPSIIKEFHVDTATMGVALSAFFWAYVAFNMPGGNLADRFGMKKVLGWSVAIWSVCTSLTGTARNVTQLMLARLGVGLGEASSIPINGKVVAALFPPQERGLVMGVFLSGIRVGNALTPIVMVFLMNLWGWRTAFIVTGAVSLLWCVVWHFGFRELSDVKVKAGPQQKIKFPWKLIVSNRAILGLTIVKFTQDFLMWMFMTWIPAYLVMSRHFSPVTMGVYVTTAYTVAAISQPVVGWISDRLIRRGWDLNLSRKSVLVTLQLLAAGIIVTAHTDTIGIAMFFMVVAISAEAVSSAVAWTILADLVPGKTCGTVGGAINTISSIGGILAPIMVGVIVKKTGSFQLALTVGGCMMLVASICVLFVMPRIKLLESLDLKVNQPLEAGVTG
jgi:ACS family glucarate transporter-like MFS transporter